MEWLHAISRANIITASKIEQIIKIFPGNKHQIAVCVGGGGADVLLKTAIFSQFFK